VYRSERKLVRQPRDKWLYNANNDPNDHSCYDSDDDSNVSSGHYGHDNPRHDTYNSRPLIPPRERA
jgi:hypothetical protein